MPPLLTMPDFDLPTRSASGFMLRHIAPRVGPMQLLSIFVRRLPFELATPRADIIIGTGHGGPDTFTGQNEAVLLQVGKYNPGQVRGKVVKLLSCETGLLLGPDLVKNGALSVLAYNDDYVWVMDADKVMTPWSDEMAAESLMPVMDSINALLDGRTAGEAFQVELAGYTRNAEGEEVELIKSCLEFNRDNAILLGDPEARVRARPKIKLPLPPPPIFIPIFQR